MATRYKYSVAVKYIDNDGKEQTYTFETTAFSLTEAMQQGRDIVSGFKIISVTTKNLGKA